MEGKMKRFVQYSILFVIVGIFVSCDSSDDPCVTPSTSFKSEIRDLKDFRDIAMAVNVAADINITQAQDFSFEIYGPDNVLELTATSVEGDVLVISSDVCFSGESDVVIDIAASD